MRIDQYFPFIEECSIVKSYRVENFELFQNQYLTFNPFYSITSQEVLNKIIKVRGLDKGAFVTIHKLVPNNVYVYLGNEEDLQILLTSPARPTNINAIITELDYSSVADSIELIYEESGTIALIRKGSNHDKCQVLTDQFILDAQQGNSTNLNTSFVEQINSSIYGRQLNEDDIDDLFKDIDNRVVSADAVNGAPPFYEMIRMYLESNTATEKIPLLVGMSGIAKSSMVKGIAHDLGMRLVDLRVSFMSRLDIDGLAQIMGKELGSPYTINAPMVEFLTCTDEYINFSRKAVLMIEEKINQLNQQGYNEEYIDKLSTALEHFREASKIPVLFFDEITRSDKSIRGALTTIINQRIYGSYNLKMARMIAATNAPVGYEDDPDMQDLFLGATLEDVAVLDRFNKIPLTPEEVYPQWIKYAQANFEPIVYEYISRHPQQAYNMKDAEDAAHNYDREDDLIPQYPTYRAWENISNYLKSVKNNSYNKDIVLGILGQTCGELFIKYLTRKKYTNKYADGTVQLRTPSMPDNFQSLLVTQNASKLIQIIKDVNPNDSSFKGMNMSAGYIYEKFVQYIKDNNIDAFNMSNSDLSVEIKKMLALPEHANAFDRIRKFYDVDYIINHVITYLFDNAIVTEVKAQEDPVTDFISDSLDAGIPTMIVGVSGLGKTTRVREYCEKRGYEFELIALATKDRMDVMGPPAMVDITKYIAKENSPVFDELGLTEEFNKLKSESGLPPSVTVRSPKSELSEKIKKCVQAGKPLVILFDEFNRCIDPTVQSSVFQAISDGEFGGVKFPPGMIKVALAGNLGETTREAGRIDAALTARATVYKKLSYDESDALAVLRYMQNHNYAQPLLDYLGEDTAKVLELIKSVDEGSLTTNVSSTRSLKALSDALLESKNSKRMHGALLCPDTKLVQDFNMRGSVDDKLFLSMIDRMLVGIKNWAAIGSYEYPGGTPLDKAIGIFTKAATAYKNGRTDRVLKDNLSTMMTNFLAIDTAISDYRTKMFSYYVDSGFAEEFTTYYNTVSGVSEAYVTIDDLENALVIPAYVTSQYNKLDAANPEWYLVMIEIYDHFGSQLDIENYHKLLLRFVVEDVSIDNSKYNLKQLLSYKDFESLIVVSSERAYGNELSEKLGYTDTDIHVVSVNNTYKPNTKGALDIRF